MDITEIMSNLVLQIGIIIIAVRFCGAAAKRIGIPSVLGELIAGVIIGPFALGGTPIPGFPQGIFFPGAHAGTLAVSPELYAFSIVGSIILLFASGLETDLSLFLRFSVAGGVIGMGGVIFSFASGVGVGAVLLNASIFDPQCLFFGILSTATSVGITARILSDQKKMDSPEGVTILAAAVFDDVLGIVLLSIVLGVVTVISGTGETINTLNILVIAAKALAIWIGFTALGLAFSKNIAAFLKQFKSSRDSAILSIGLAMLLSGFFEHQRLAMIIGAYVMGLSLSKTDISAVIQERIRGIYEFFVPVFFAVMGMMVNINAIFSREVLIIGGIYTLTAVLAKVIGCGGPAFLLGFNVKGALRIGTGMVPRGEVALIIAGLGLASGILNQQTFSAVILMTLLTTLVAPPLLNLTLKIKGSGTKKSVIDEDSASAVWNFDSKEISEFVVDTLLKDLRNEGFYIQLMNIDDGLSQARREDMTLSIIEAENTITIETSKSNMPFVKVAMYEVIIELHNIITKLEKSSNAEYLKRELAEMQGSAINSDVLSVIQKSCVSLDLKGGTKDEIIAELVKLLAFKGKLTDYEIVLRDVMERENISSTGMEHGIAIPHAKTTGVTDTVVAIGIKKEGVDFASVDGEKSRLFILTVSPMKNHRLHLQFLSAINTLLKDRDFSERAINAASVDEFVGLFQ